jgi:hypothetical protein
MPLAPVRQAVPGLGAHSASVRHTNRALPLHAPVALAATHAGMLMPLPTQHTWPTAQLVGVHGGAVHTRLAALPLLPPPPPIGEQVFSGGQVVASVHNWRRPLGQRPSAPGAAQAGAAPPPPPLPPRQHNSPGPQLSAVQGGGAQTLLLLQMLPALHSVSSWQSWAAPAAHASSHVAVVPLPVAFWTRQHTWAPAQLSPLEQDALVVVPAGQAAVDAAQLNVLLLLLLLLFMPPPPAPGTVQHVGLGATQKLPPAPHATAPVSPRFTGAVVSRLGSSVTTTGTPSPVAPVVPVLEVPAPPGRSGFVELLPAAPGALPSASLFELPHAAAMAAATNTTETLERTREYFILADLF